MKTKAPGINAFTLDRERFARVNEAGAARYGLDWINANEGATALLRSFGIDPQHNKALGASIALFGCVATERKATGRKPLFVDTSEKVRRLEDAVAATAGTGERIATTHEK